ncbi:hypothetical protein D9M68_18380 [compost metagenome]
MFWDLLCYPYRKKKLIEALILWAETVFLAKTTYMSYYDIGANGQTYGRHALCFTVSKIIQETFAEKGLEAEFFSSGMAQRIQGHFDNLICLGSFKGDHYAQIVFIEEKGVAAKDIAFLVGDAVMCDMSKAVSKRFMFSDLLFDVYCSKGDPDVPSKVYGNERYSLSIIRLKEV